MSESAPDPETPDPFRLPHHEGKVRVILDRQRISEHDYAGLGETLNTHTPELVDVTFRRVRLYPGDFTTEAGYNAANLAFRAETIEITRSEP